MKNKDWSSNEAVLAEGRKYASRSAFKEGSHYPYVLALRRGLLDQLYPKRNIADRGLVYILTTPDGKEYVGQTAGPMWQRLVRHRRDAQRDATRPICAAFLQHGQSAIKVTIIASGVESRKERAALESGLIEERGTQYPGGLNVAPRDGNVDHLHTASVREKSDAGRRRFAKENPDILRARMDHARASPACKAATRALCLARNAKLAKLKPEMLEPIISAVLDGESKKSIGARYGVSGRAISLFIQRNKVSA